MSEEWEVTWEVVIDEDSAQAAALAALAMMRDSADTQILGVRRLEGGPRTWFDMENPKHPAVIGKEDDYPSGA